ncbi:MAG: anti-sigma factor family protein [Phycisphaerae bacterium]
MNHQQARETLPLYADGELDPQRTAELEGHLARSAELRAELERWRALRRCANRVVAAPAVPIELEHAVRERLRHRRWARRRRPLQLFAGVTAIAAVIVVMFVLWRAAPTAAQPRLLGAERFAQVHRRCALEHPHRQVDVDLHDIEAAHDTLAELVAYPVLVPDLQDHGFEFDGVCQCFGVRDVVVVHAFYRRGGPEPAVLSFFSLDQKVGLESADASLCRSKIHADYETAQHEDVIVYKWDETANSYAVCGRMKADQVRDLADAVKVASLQEPLPVFARAEP